jgi:conjugative relaxase-like TrwC/TraI family protein
MFTAKPQKNRASATEYFDEHLAQNDYYSEGQKQAGYWIGQGAQRLGLKEGESVNRDAFLRLCDNQHPDTGQKLTPVQLSERRVFFDFTCSAPKSVSILAVTMNDQRLVQAHSEAAALALKELETFAGTRVRKDGAMTDRTTGNLVSAAFLHTSSRALDPQLHTHFTVFNATFDPVEARWKALQTEKMFAAIRYGTAVYRNELTKRLHAFGYETRTAKHGFEIAGVAPEIIERFSKRSQQRNAAVARKEKQLGRKLSNDEISHVVHQTRPEKRKDATDTKVRAAQLDELGFWEKRALKKLITQANGEQKELAVRVDVEEASRYALAHVFARQSVAPEHKLLESALEHGRGQIEVSALKQTFTAHKDLVRVGGEVSTREILQAELSLIGTVNCGLNAVEPLARGFLVNDKLGDDQRAALNLVLSSPDRITGFRGRAGTGKTTTLQELDRALKTSGYEAVFCAPTAVATEGLRKEGLDAVTLAKFLSAEQRTLSAKSVIVLDEAGAVGTADMKALFARVVAGGGRAVLVGDTAQHASVAQGDALRIIENHSGYRFGQLTQIRRQKCEALKEIVTLAAARKSGEAFTKLRGLGEVNEVASSAELYARAASAYVMATRAGKSALLVSPTWAEIDAVTAEVRMQLKQCGALGGRETVLPVFDSFGWTDAEKTRAVCYEPGQQLRFVKPTKQFKVGEMVEVAKVSGKTVYLQRSDGRNGVVAPFQPGRAPGAFDVGQKRELPITAGDWLLLQSNAGKLLNGERVQVKSVANGVVTLGDGRTLPAEYRTFTHGYAVTSHSAQSKTVDEVIVVASSRSFAAVSQEQFYVSISRARERAQVFTDDAEQLARCVGEAHSRKAAIELEGLREALTAQGYTPRRESEIAREDLSNRRKGRGVRPMRDMRELRVSAQQQLVRWAKDFRRWMHARRNIQQEVTASRELTRQRANTTEHIHVTQRIDPPRQSRGYHI